MKYYLALDNGGTKAAAILYDEELNRIGVCVVGSLRSNTNNAAQVDMHLKDLADGLGLYGKTIEELDGAYEIAVAEKLKNICEIKNVNVSGELGLGLSAAGIFGDGLLALCGTGATAFARLNGQRLLVGGYGASVSDEGSGYYIGRCACIAAAHDDEERGEFTRLTDEIPRHFGFSGREEFQASIFSIYKRKDISPVTQVAGCAPVVIKAAADGDKVCVGILKEAGRMMGEQMCYLIKKHGIKDDVPLTFSGSLWRGNPIFTKEFKNVVYSQCKDRKTVIPVIEPILGALALQKKKQTGTFTEDDAKMLADRFPEFRYNMNENKK